MRILAILAVAALLGSGFFIGLRALLDYPSHKSCKAIKQSKQPMEKKKLLAQIEPILLKLAAPVSKIIPLNPNQEKEMAAMLEDAELPYTPKLYLARSVCIFLLVAAISIPCFMLSVFAGLFTLALAVFAAYVEQEKVYSVVKKQRQFIEAELPRFTQHVALAIQKTSNVTGILEVYRPMAGKTFGKELEKTIADIRTSDVQGALTRFSHRINSTMLSEVVRGLRSVDQGIDQGTHFQLLAFTYRDRQNQLLKKEALKKPGKISSVAFLGCLAVLIQIIVIFGTQFKTSLGVFNI